MGRASSELPNSRNIYSLEKAFDEDRRTAWVEGGPGTKGEWIQIDFLKPLRMWGIGIVVGYTKSGTTFCSNAVPESLEIAFTGSNPVRVLCRSVNSFRQTGDEIAKGFIAPRDGCYPDSASDNLTKVHMYLHDSLRTINGFRVSFLSNIGTSRWSDMAITELFAVGPDFTTTLLSPEMREVLSGISNVQRIRSALLKGAEVRSESFRALVDGGRSMDGTRENIRKAESVPRAEALPHESDPVGVFMLSNRDSFIKNLVTILVHPKESIILGNCAVAVPSTEAVEEYLPAIIVENANGKIRAMKNVLMYLDLPYCPGNLPSIW